MRVDQMITTLDAWWAVLDQVCKDPAVIDCDDRLVELKDEISALADRFRDGEGVAP